MRELCEVLKEWNCDIEGAMERFLDDKALYEEFVESIVEEENFSLLKNSFDEKNYEEAFEYAHTLKGVTGNLGLTPLYEVICNLVEELREKRYEEVEQYYAAVAVRYDDFCNIIRNSSYEK